MIVRVGHQHKYKTIAAGMAALEKRSAVKKAKKIKKAKTHTPKAPYVTLEKVPAEPFSFIECLAVGSPDRVEPLIDGNKNRCYRAAIIDRDEWELLARVPGEPNCYRSPKQIRDHITRLEDALLRALRNVDWR